MKFEIIKNSESNTGYNIPDCEYMGQTCYLNGWQFEMVKADGTICYSEVKFTYATPEAFTGDGFEAEYLNWVMRCNDLTFTGRVIFRGYYEEYYDDFDGSWEEYVREVPFEIGALLYEETTEPDDSYDERYEYLYDLV